MPSAECSAFDSGAPAEPGFSTFNAPVPLFSWNRRLGTGAVGSRVCRGLQRCVRVAMNPDHSRSPRRPGPPQASGPPPLRPRDPAIPGSPPRFAWYSATRFALPRTLLASRGALPRPSHAALPDPPASPIRFAHYAPAPRTVNASPSRAAAAAPARSAFTWYGDRQAAPSFTERLAQSPLRSAADLQDTAFSSPFLRRLAFLSGEDAALRFHQLRRAAAANSLSASREALLHDLWAEVWTQLAIRIGRQARNIFITAEPGDELLGLGCLVPSAQDDGTELALSPDQIRALFFLKPGSLAKYGHYLLEYEAYIYGLGLPPWPVSLPRLISYLRHRADAISDDGAGRTVPRAIRSAFSFASRTLGLPAFHAHPIVRAIQARAERLHRLPPRAAPTVSWDMLSALERFLCSPGVTGEALLPWSLLASVIWILAFACLRFSDVQRCALSTLHMTTTGLSGSCWDTKTGPRNWSTPRCGVSGAPIADIVLRVLRSGAQCGLVGSDCLLLTPATWATVLHPTGCVLDGGRATLAIRELFFGIGFDWGAVARLSIHSPRHFMAQLACRGARLSAESQDVLVAKICELTGHRSDRVARDYAGREALEYRRSHLVASLVAAASSHPDMRPVPEDISIDRLDHAIDSLQPEHIFRALDHGVADDAQEEAAEVQRQAAAAADPGIDEPPCVLTEDPPAVGPAASRSCRFCGKKYTYAGSLTKHEATCPRRV